MPKKPTLSQAVRGRSMVDRDYTTGVRFKSAERKADEAVTQAGLGIVQGVAGGVAQLTGAIESNIKSHELAVEGARSVFESSGVEGSFEESGFQSAEGWRDRWFKSAAEVSETATIAGGTFDTAKLVELGRLSPVSRTKAAGRSLDKYGEPTGEYKSLYEEFRMQEPLGRNITPSQSMQVGSKDDPIKMPVIQAKASEPKIAETQAAQTQEVTEQVVETTTGEEPTISEWRAIPGNEGKRYAEYYEEYPTLKD